MSSSSVHTLVKVGLRPPPSACEMACPVALKTISSQMLRHTPAEIESSTPTGSACAPRDMVTVGEATLGAGDKDAGVAEAERVMDALGVLVADAPVENEGVDEPAADAEMGTIAAATSKDCT